MTSVHTQQVELRLLGGFGLQVGGQTVDVTPAAQRLLAFVALTPRGAERSYTAFQLWPEHDERRAKANLRSALWRLGKVDAVLIEATKSRLRLADGVWIDVRHGLDELTEAEPQTTLETVRPMQALDHDLLPDWYDDWLTIERERLRQFRLGTLEDAARHALVEGHHNAAVQLALAAVAIEPIRESSHRLVIDAHLAAGNRIEAQRQLDVYQQMLRSALGHEPTDMLSEVIPLPNADWLEPALLAG
ncbi:MAG: BTAD domain-containing putative transcriptional regulator [Actinomycetota bacterium]